MLKIDVLGPVRAWIGDGPVELGPLRQRAVLARLATAIGQVVPVDRLIEDLWAGDPPPRAQAALQVYVSNLRRALEPDRPPRTPAQVIVTAAPGYTLRLPADQLDAGRFEELTRSAIALLDAGPDPAYHRLDAALACWRGPAYVEFADEAWAAAEAGRLAELRLVAVEHRARAALALGRAAQVAPELERHVRAHPLREQAVALLALALYRSGRQADALGVLRRLRAELADQLGVDPSPDLRALETDLLHQAPSLQQPAPAGPLRPTAPPGPAGPVAPTPASGDPLPRPDEMARLRRVAAHAVRAGFQVSWVSGDAGAGKTTLGRLLAGEFTADGWRTATGRCPELDGAPPAWAWGELLRALRTGTEPTPEQAHRLAPLLSESGAPAPLPGGEFHLRRAVGDYLTTVAAAGPLLLLLDDVHRADGETLQVLRHLAVALADRPVLVVASYRPDEVNDDLVAARAALAGAHSEDVALAGLPEADVAELLRRHGAGEVGPDLVRAVWQRTGGNPLFVTETARLISAEGPSAAVAGVPAGLRHVLRRRLARLPAAARTTLRTASVIGPDVDVDLLIEVVGGPEETVLDGLEAGLLAGLLVEPRPGQVRFAHALMRDALYEDIPLLRRTRAHHRTLEALERRRPGEVADLGRHALAALTTSTAERAVRYASAAARQAADLDAPREAAALWSGASRAIALLPDTPLATRLAGWCARAAATARAGDLVAARQIRGEAVALAAMAADPAALRRALTCLDAPVAGTVRPDRDIDAEFVGTVEQALTQLGPADPVSRCRLLCTLVSEVAGADDDRADEASREALRLAREIGDPELLCRALNARYLPALAPGRRAELPTVGAELLRVATAHGLTGYRAQAHHMLFQAALHRADLADARRHVTQAVEQATTGQLGLMLAVLSGFDALTALFAGDHPQALRRYDEVAQRMAPAGGPDARATAVLGRFVVRLTTGGAGESVPELRQAHARGPGDFHDLLALALLDAGEPAQARAVWRPDLPLRPDHLWLFRACVRGQVAARLGDRDAARHWYAELSPWRGCFAGLETGALSLGPVDQTLAALAGLLDDPAAADRHRADGRRLARRVGAVPWLAGEDG
ncbi:BTAD domain-containing putative transcriptional regulator [Micromonospora sp. NPDC092111]|uniref:BTAD domain-containing putative transcriptional regulator n=1 Tax=Micromonospora sp. NPDC092111 TaxID=3364289 RepID=UPI00382420B2